MRWGEIQEGGIGPELSGFGRTLFNIIVDDNNFFYVSIRLHWI
jgi:hypothetical protein